MNSGKVFENNFKESINDKSIYYLRLKDSPSSFGKDSKFVRFTNNNPYDVLCVWDGICFPLELKTTKGKSFSIQREKKENGNGKKIKYHQIEGLTTASQYYNIYAGFLFNFEKDENADTYWMGIQEFNKFLQNNSKKSINEQDILSLDHILVESRKLKVNYRYNIFKLFKEIVSHSNHERKE